MKYIVIEMQTTGGSTSIISDVFDEPSLADQKYYTILSFAAVSTVEVHTAVLMNEVGDLMKSESFTHVQPSPEPDPEQA